MVKNLPKRNFYSIASFLVFSNKIPYAIKLYLFGFVNFQYHLQKYKLCKSLQVHRRLICFCTTDRTYGMLTVIYIYIYIEAHSPI